MPTLRDPYRDPNRDPYRTLGLAPGASLEEVKRAYRRLAKANHPDTAGPSAIPRFLAIQSAYETLAGLRPAPQSAADTAGAPPWRADPARARATREAWQSRAGRRPPSGASSGADTRAGGSTPGAGAGAAGASADADPGAGTRRRRGTGRGRSGPGTHRPPNRATPGSTSYDFAEHEFDPEWSGASWYGPSSGTYWTINPKEYADPRKHGPEYQARARRGASGQPGPDGTPGVEDAPPEASAEGDAAGIVDDAPADDPGARPNASGPDPARPRQARSWGGGGTAAGEAEAARGDLGPESTQVPPRPRFVPPRGEPGVGRFAHPPAGTRGAPREGGALVGGTSVEAGAPASVEDALVASVWSAGFFRSRVALALFGWPPIGIGLAFVLGELSGCGRFAATCVDSFALGTWVAQLAVIAVLLLVPGLASIAAVGTLATLAAAVPTAVLLSAAGGSRDPSTAAAALAVLLAVAWTGGVLIGVVRRSRTVPP